MDYAKLRKHLGALASLPGTAAPVISAYFDLNRERQVLLGEFREWAGLTRQTFHDRARGDFDDAADEVESWLAAAGGRSAAVFCRWGEHPLFLPMQFEAPLESRFHADQFPAIYPLVELKDRFNRFVVVLTTAEYARIVEINLGGHSLELLTERPALRERIGREWTREHYANHRHERNRRFMKEKIAVIDSLMAKRGHNALVVAGDPYCVTLLVSSLPDHLKRKLVGKLNTGVSGDGMHELVAGAVESFLEAEARDARDAVDLLIQAVRTGGLATVGFGPTRRALDEGRAERLIVSSSLEHADREELVRLASKLDLPIETVQDCELLDQNGGAGALLRHDLGPPSEDGLSGIEAA